MVKKQWSTPTLTQLDTLIIQASENEILIEGLRERIRDLEAEVRDLQAAIADKDAKIAELLQVAPYRRERK